MDVRKAALIGAALIIALTTALLARSMFSDSGSGTPQIVAAAAPAQPAGPSVLVATKALPVGTIVTAESFRFQPWPKEMVEAAYFTSDNGANPAKLVGSVVRNAITAGQPITQGSLVQPGDRGFLAAALSPGMRAVTVAVSAQSSVAGLVFPGDRVDLMLTQTVANGGSSDPLRVTETILRNLRVLATDQRTAAVGEDGRPMVSSFSNVTFEVTPKMAEKIAVAQTIGSLSLSLRSMADTASDLDLAIAKDGVALPKGNDPKAEKSALAKIAARPSTGASTYSTGADVSRFQRATIPAPSAASAGGSNGATGTMGGAQAGGGLGLGPVVQVARGNAVTEVSVGGK